MPWPQDNGHKGSDPIKPSQFIKWLVKPAPLGLEGGEDIEKDNFQSRRQDRYWPSYVKSLVWLVVHPRAGQYQRQSENRSDTFIRLKLGCFSVASFNR